MTTLVDCPLKNDVEVVAPFRKLWDSAYRLAVYTLPRPQNYGQSPDQSSSITHYKVETREAAVEQFSNYRLVRSYQKTEEV